MKLPRTGFELPISGVGSDHSANRATPTALQWNVQQMRECFMLGRCTIQMLKVCVLANVFNMCLSFAC